MPDPEKQNQGAEGPLPNPEQFNLTNEKFEEYVRSRHKFTLETLSGESENPTLLVVTRNMDLKDELVCFMIAAPFNDAEVKQKIMRGMGKKFFEEKQIVLAIIFSSEAWLAKRPTEGDWQDVMPRDDPHRQEVIIVCGAGLDPTQRMLITTPIRRDKENNHIIVDGESTEMNGEDGKFFLLDCFWRGYFETIAKKMKASATNPTNPPNP